MQSAYRMIESRTPGTSPNRRASRFVLRANCASLGRVNKRRSSAKDKGERSSEASEGSSRFECVAEMRGLPFETFEQLRAAVAIRSFNVGVDALAAAKWSDNFNSTIKKAIVTALSLLLVAAALAAIVAVFLTNDYWLIAAVPIQILTFYTSHPASPIRKWITIAGALSVAVFIDLLMNGFLIAATLTAYAGLTFAAVRAAGYISNAGFRKAILSDEQLFLEAYANGECTVKNNQSGRVYSA